MPVRQRGKSWQADFRWQGKRTRETLPTKEAAAKWITDSIDALTKGDAIMVNGKVVMRTVQATAQTVEDQGANTYTLTKLVQDTYDLHWKGTNNAKDSLRNAKDVAKVLGANKHPSRVTSKAIMEMVLEMKKRPRNAPATINRKLSALSTMLKYGKKLEVVTNVPELPWESERGSERCRMFTDKEESTVLDWFERQERRDMRDLIVLLIDCGVRLSEAIKLTVRDVEKFEVGECIRIWGNVRATRKKDAERKGTKNASSRSVPMTNRVAEMLLERKAALPVGEQRFFHTLSRHTAENWWTWMREAIGQADDPEFVMHTCRHTWASRLAMLGGTARDLMELGGWKTERMVQRYTHLTPDHKRNLIAKLDARNDVRPGNSSVVQGEIRLPVAG